MAPNAAVRLVMAAALAAIVSSSDIPNWVSPINASQSGCYRKTYLSTKTCAAGYGSDGIATCWAQCPLDYPVECGFECIPQSADCSSQVLTKVKSVATVALNAATAGVFGELVKASEALVLGVKCGQKLFAATSSLVSYVDELQTNATQKEQLLSVVNQSDLVVNEIPAAVSTCLGLPVNEDTLALSAQVVGVVNQIVTEVVENGGSVLEPSNFLAFMKDVGVDDSVQDLDPDSLAQLQEILSAGTTCGTKLQSIINKVTQFIVAIKSKDPLSTIAYIRQALSGSEMLVSDIPAVTNNCVRNVTDDAYTTRDSLRTVMSTITDGLVDASEDDGKALSTSNYLASVAKMGLDVIGTLDPTGIADMMSTFIQPICGPTAFIGEIDDGSAKDALALTTEGYVFKGSYGTWRKAGDGLVNITLQSFDSEDVTVVIHSGGDTIAKVKVRSGETVYWNSTVKELQDKTLYFDRWRPGPLNVPVSSGGSLLMWVPRSSAGGKIDLYVKINGDEDDSSSADNAKQNGSNSDQGSSSTTPTPTTTSHDAGQTELPGSSNSGGGAAPAASGDEPAPTAYCHIT